MARTVVVEANLELPLHLSGTSRRRAHDLLTEMVSFAEHGRASERLVTTASTFSGEPMEVPTFVNEFWTAKQRNAHSLHEVSYRACFKPQLPGFFIERLTQPGDVVYDPFMGRGTTLLQAALLGRAPAGCDVNPLSSRMIRPRLNPPHLADVQERLREIPFHSSQEIPDELLVFYHPDTLKQILALKAYLIARERANALDAVDDWICMVALNRLTGHSSGFFSVYTMPPNQAVSVKAQARINERRKQTPTRRDVPALILRKSRQLLGACNEADRHRLQALFPKSQLVTSASDHTPQLGSGSVSLVVTSPPFLDVVDYATDNWLRCWFLGIDAGSVKLTIARKLEEWQRAMSAVFVELHRVLKVGGHVAFEVGEVKGGKIKLEEAILPCGVAAGLTPVMILINAQRFTKTANCWGIENNSKGTNTNRIVVFRKEA